MLIFNFLALQRSQAAQGHIQDGLRLNFIEVKTAHQVRARSFNPLRPPNDAYHLIQIFQCDQISI